MDSASDLLPGLAAALVVTAAALSAAGRRQRRYPGWRCWAAAPWLTAAGVAAAAVPALAVPATWLLLCGPVLVLCGARRFHARHALPGSPRLDAAVLVLAGAAATLGPPFAGDVEAAALLAALPFALLHLYVAGLMFCGPGGRDALPLQALGMTAAAVALAALAPLPPGWAGDAALAPLGLRAAAAALGALVPAFVAMALVAERTERQLLESQRRLHALAHTDALTNVPNRRHFQERAALALRADAPGSATLLAFDIDHFKQLNDLLGHAAGDRALRLVSGCMLADLRAHDVACRYGGDEFVILLRNTRVQDAGSIAARIVERLQAQAEQALLPALSLSFGMVQVQPRDALADALRRADQALYEAKRQGRSRAVTAQGDEAQPVFSESQRLGLTAI